MTRRVLLGALLLLLLLTGGAPAEEKWGPFRGRVVDVETGQGIAEAVILAIWLETWSSPIETHTRFYDAKEALTRPDGTFEIPRLTPPFFRFRIMEPEFRVFAPGYADARSDWGSNASRMPSPKNENPMNTIMISTVGMMPR